MPASVMNIRSPLPPNQGASTSLPLNTQGPVMKMEPLTTLQVPGHSSLSTFHYQQDSTKHN
ncbi:hypothetical protein DPMN_007482 [Dreissena polymorpha]|uniref:Uncharacterized protein n=1 Tax=Dreissena polymorpha TaxID=45954 RepID=A0A9D4MWA3_DREPO|nr:hypothetical protein DPMN_007482 [Dreissena polymorpha]